ncbi:MAG: lysophospholipid acyltransferase family protein [Lachnospiraceae bacterium]|nr:lysophospholipid acyltransferase family protein [Lachnospiraceae bacterium]
MIRFLIGILFVVLYLILSIPILLVETVIRHFNPEAAEKSMLRIVQWVFWVIYHIAGVKVTVIGRENIPEDQAALFVGNHQGFFDVIVGYTLMKTRTGFIAKKSFEKVPLLSWNMKFLYCLFLDREDLKQGLKTILTAIDYVKSGISIFIYPEGTRNKSGDETNLAEFHGGSFKIAQRTKCPIIPVAVNHTEAVFEKQFPRIKPQHVIIEFGEPVYYQDLPREDQKQVGEYFRVKIRDMVIKNQAAV